MENLRSWFQAVFFPQDISRCLEYVMQISYKFNSRSISKDRHYNLFNSKFGVPTDFILYFVPELL